MSRSLFSIPLVAAVTILATTCTSEGAWDTIRRQQALVSQNLIWRQRVPLTLDNSFPASDELVDFPVLILLDDSNIDMDLFAPGGRDIRFHAEPIAGRMPHEMPALPHEVEHWDPDGVSAVWVRVPRIPAGSPDTRIWLYLDNPTATDRQRPTDVWSNGYVGVWHLNEADPPYRDSGPNGLHGTSEVNGFTTPERVAGPSYGYAQDFRASPTPDRGIVIPAHPAVGDLGPLTLSFWFQLEAVVNGARFFHKGPMELWISNSHPEFAVGHSGPKLFRSFTNPWSLGSWQHFAVRWDGEPDPAGVSLYRDGQLFDTVFNSGTPTDERTSDASKDLIIGNVSFGPPPERPTPGIVSSVQLSSVVRSSGWIRATHRGFNGSFVSIGAPEAVQYR